MNDYHSSRLQYITTSPVNIGGLGILRSHRRVSSRNLHLQGIARSAELSTAWFPSEFPLLFIWKQLSRKKMEQLWIPWLSRDYPMSIPLFQSLTFRIFWIFWLESQPSIHHHSFCSVVSGRALRKAGAKSRGWWSRAGMVSWMVCFMENPNRKWMIWSLKMLSIAPKISINDNEPVDVGYPIFKSMCLFSPKRLGKTHYNSEKNIIHFRF